MSQEIVYTSVPKGLKAGSYGYCTVVSTNGMAKNLAERLEGLSGYRHAYDPNDQRNPVNYSHLIMTVGGRKFHILSRICDAGLDYTQRNNKLAHHVALEASEVNSSPSGSPALVLASSGFCITHWDEVVTTVPAGRKKVPNTERKLQPCTEWEKATGDAGWAGVLAESALRKTTRPTFVIFDPEKNEMLGLVVEAMSLLPPEKRWEISFSTYFTKLPAGIECQWRFLLEGTSEADAARRDPHSFIIDLCENLGAPTESELVTAARTGQVLFLASPSQPIVRPPAVVPPERNRKSVSQHHVEEVVAQKTEAKTYALKKSRRVVEGDSPPQVSSVSPKPRRKPKLALMILCFLILCLLVASPFILRSNSRSKEDSEKGPAMAKQNHLDSRQTSREPEQIVFQRLPGDHNSEQKPSDFSKSGEDAIKTPPPSPTGETPISQTKGERDPDKQHSLQDALPRHKNLFLPDRNRGLSSNNEPDELAKIRVESPKDCELKIIGDEIVLDPGQFFVLKESDPREGIRTWEVSEKGEGLAEANPIGKFQLQKQKLTFQWNNKSKSTRLRYALLQIKVGNRESKRYALYKPKEFDVGRLNFKRPEFNVPLGRIPNDFHHKEGLRLELKFRGLREDKFKINGKNPFSANHKLKLNFFDPHVDRKTNKNLKKYIDVEISFETEDHDISLIYENFVFVTLFKPVESPEYGEKQLSKKQLTLPEIKESTTRIPFGKKTFAAATQSNNLFRNVLTEIIVLERVRKLMEQNSEKLKELGPKNDPNEEKRKKVQSEQKMLSKYKKAYEFVDKHEKEWQYNLSNQYGTLEKVVEIEFRLFYEIEGRQIDLIRSKSFGR